jgi:RNA polymerase sigma factor (sigma-70 family)
VVADDARYRLSDALVRTGAEDRAAFREVYELTSAKLFGICLRICEERQAAEDVLHEVYLIIWRRAGAYQPDRGSPISWLAAIARNRAIDWRRANPLRTRPLEVVDAAVADPALLASDTMLADEDARRLHDCLGALDAAQQSAIRTAFFEGLTYPELAARWTVPLGTIKSRVRRGLAQLKECLGLGG